MSSCPLPAAPGAPARGGHRHNFLGMEVLEVLSGDLPLVLLPVAAAVIYM